MLISEDFLLKNSTAKEIFKVIDKLPIIDYHCHLDPSQISRNQKFDNITKLWLGGDHYKWRLMRTNGVLEKFITGDAPDYDKFFMWATTVEDLIGNPVYHWTHLELKRYFGYEGLLTQKTAKDVYEHCNKIISKSDFCVFDILEKFKIEVLCTTDDPNDDLEFHKNIKNLNTKVLPTFRPSKAFDIESPNFFNYIQDLENNQKSKINCYEDFKNILYSKIDFFDENNCKLSDHSLDYVTFEACSEDEVNKIFKNRLANNIISKLDISKFKTLLFYDLCLKYYEKNWSVQIHMNCIRNANTKMFNLLGPDTGYDCISDNSFSYSLVKTLDSLDSIGKLPKTILYSLNPNNNDMLTTIIGCFQGDGIKGKIQLGSAWWFNDNLTGMKNQMISLANNGMLARFVGMLTDSRSFLSFPRHEYFRRLLASIFGDFVEQKLFPDDIDLLTKIASNISYYNAKEYFKF